MNKYIPKASVFNFIKANTSDIKTQIDSDREIVSDFNTPQLYTNGMVVYFCDPSTQKVEDSGACHPWL